MGWAFTVGNNLLLNILDVTKAFMSDYLLKNINQLYPGIKEKLICLFQRENNFDWRTAIDQRG